MFRPFRTWPATAVAYASRTLGMEVSVERIRLAFPLRLTVDNTLLADRTDTLLRCGRLSLDAALWPLIRKEVAIRSFALERVAAHYKDTLAGMDLRLAAGELSLEAVRADLSATRPASPGSFSPTRTSG